MAGCAAASGSTGGYSGLEDAGTHRPDPSESPPPSNSDPGGYDAGGGGQGGGSGSGTVGSGTKGGTEDASAPVDAAPSVQCGVAKTDCGGTCVSVDDPAFGCGDPSCGACGSANGTAGCAQGQCVMVSCNANWANCTGDPAGCTTDLTTDSNCGACGNQCGVEATQGHAISSCINAPILGPSCVMICLGSWANCDGDPSNGCEVNTDSDVYNCGSCGNDCTAQGYTSCVSGACQ